MGKDIALVRVNKDGTAEEVESESLSGNFSSQILSRYFYIYELDRHKVTDAIPILEAGITKLKAAGFKEGIPDLTNNSWGWGVHERKGQTTEIMPDQEFAGVFLFHLNRILKKLVLYPEYYVVLEFSSSDSVTMNDGTKTKPKPEVDYSVDSSFDDISNSGRICTYYRHPTKGQMKIDTWKLAMEIYGIETALDSERADSWLELAQKMADFPKKN